MADSVRDGIESRQHGHVSREGPGGRRESLFEDDGFLRTETVQDGRAVLMGVPPLCVLGTSSCIAVQAQPVWAEGVQADEDYGCGLVGQWLRTITTPWRDGHGEG